MYPAKYESKVRVIGMVSDQPAGSGLGFLMGTVQFSAPLTPCSFSGGLHRLSSRKTDTGLPVRREKGVINRLFRQPQVVFNTLPSIAVSSYLNMHVERLRYTDIDLLSAICVTVCNLILIFILI